MKMERRGFRKSLIAFLVWFSASASPLLADEPKNDLSKFFTDVVKAITGQNRAPVIRDVVAEPLLPVPEDEADERKLRLEHYFAVASNWVDEICDLSAEQRKQLDKFVVDRVADSQAKYAKNNTVRQAQQAVPDYMPIKFVTKAGAGYLATKYDWNQFLKKLLTQEQLHTIRQGLTDILTY